MPTWTGYFSNSGSPALKVRIGGVFPDTEQEFETIIDTGFTGFLSLPLLSAFPLALVLFGTTSVILADGSVQPKLTAWGFVKVGEEKKFGVIVLESSSTEVLIGMELLKTFGKELQVCSDPAKVLLIDAVPPAPTA